MKNRNEYLRPWIATPPQAVDFVDCGGPQRGIHGNPTLRALGLDESEESATPQAAGKMTAAILRLVVCFITILSMGGPSVYGEWAFEKIESVLTSRDGSGGENVHMPSILVTQNGTVVITCQLRKESQWDFGNEVDILITRSHDGGKTWEKPSVLYSGPGINTVNGPLIEDRVTGELMFAFSPIPVGAESQEAWVNEIVSGGGILQIIKSTDDGATWSSPVDVKPIDPRGRVAWPSNAGHGIQLPSGRLILGAFVADPISETEHFLECEYSSGLMFSDDHGKTWHIGATIPYNGTDENVVALTASGELYYNFRHNNRTPKDVVRGYAFSRDGGESFYEIGLQDNMSRTNCHVGLVPYQGPDRKHRDILLYSGPYGGGEGDKMKQHQRTRLTLRASFDGGRNWPVAQVIEEGYAGYSDLAVLEDGTILCIYGVDTFHHDNSRMDLLRFSFDAIENVYYARRKDSN